MMNNRDNRVLSVLNQLIEWERHIFGGSEANCWELARNLRDEILREREYRQRITNVRHAIISANKQKLTAYQTVCKIWDEVKEPYEGDSPGDTGKRPGHTCTNQHNAKQCPACYRMDRMVVDDENARYRD